jgi:hypothetical protein
MDTCEDCTTYEAIADEFWNELCEEGIVISSSSYNYWIDGLHMYTIYG